MQKKLIVAGGALAGLALVSGGAFTASNTMPAGDVQGYGQVVSTGATVTSMTTNTVSGDASKVASVVFSTTTDVTGKTVKLTLKNGTTTVGSSYACTTSGTASPWTITCNTTDNPLLSSYDTSGLTVL